MSLWRVWSVEALAVLVTRVLGPLILSVATRAGNLVLVTHGSGQRVSTYQFVGR